MWVSTEKIPQAVEALGVWWWVIKLQKFVEKKGIQPPVSLNMVGKSPNETELIILIIVIISSIHASCLMTGGYTQFMATLKCGNRCMWYNHIHTYAEYIIIYYIHVHMIRYKMMIMSLWGFRGITQDIHLKKLCLSHKITPCWSSSILGWGKSDPCTQMDPKTYPLPKFLREEPI